MISKFIMYEGGFDDCKIPYVDCRGYYDLTAEIAGLILTGVIAYMVISNYRELKQEKKRFQQSEYNQSLKRKIQINLLNLIFLAFFIGHIIYSMILFQLSFEQSPNQMIKSNLNKWYKCSEIIFIILLNLLLLSVSSLYCRGLTFFFIVKQLPAPIWFGQKAKYIIWLVAIYCFGVAIAGCVLVMVKDPQNQFIPNLLIGLSTALSTILFIFYRFNYHQNILLSVKMCRKVLMRQKIYNILVFVSSFLRIGLCILAMIGLQWQEVRKFNTNCNDTSLFHSLILLLNTIAVDLFPPFVFARIFTTFERQRHLNNDIEQTLFSIQPSQMVSALSRE